MRLLTFLEAVYGNADSNPAEYAARWDDNSQTEGVEEFNWRFIPNLPLRMFVGTPGTVVSNQSLEDWSNWFREEVQAMQQDMGNDLWSELSQEEIQEPIVVAIYNSEWDLWDGWHRVGGSIAAGRDTIPAVLGTQGVQEGMDNAFFFSKDDSSAPQYPLPTNSKKYKNIKSKRRGGAKIKVKVDPNSMENVV